MSFFNFRDFRVRQSEAALKVGTDAMIFGALVNAVGHKIALDIGTGTGVLTLMMAQKNESLKIDAIEKNDQAILDATFNFYHSPFNERIQLIHQDFMDYSLEGNYDLIFSNPPFYVNTLKGESNELNDAKHVADLTPEMLLAKVALLLTRVGSFWLIWPSETIDLIVSNAEKVDLFPRKRIHVYGKPSSVVREVVEFQFGNGECETETLTIRESNGEYTDQYKALTINFHDRKL